MEQIVYYKATRPNGLDFWTQTVDYAGHLASGQPLPAKPTQPNGLYALCSDQVYHASEVPTQTLIGGTWPCRLFEVTGTPVTMPTEDRKLGFTTLTIVREIEAWQALGPNGQQVAAMIDQVSQLTANQVSELHAAWAAAGDAAWAAAWDAARNAARVAAWDAAGVAARDAAGDAAWDAAWVAAGDAAGAFVVRDLISAEHFRALVGPWLSVMGEPMPGGQS